MRKAALVVAGVLATGLIPGQAQAAPRLKVIAKGLDEPRGLAVGRDGTVYVAEAGRAGKKCVKLSDWGGKACFGQTGAVTSIKKGRQKRIYKGLPSIALKYGGPSGPQDLAFDAKGRLRLLLGGMSKSTHKKFGPAARKLGTVIGLPGRGVLADITGSKATRIPDGEDHWVANNRYSDPQSFVVNKDGSMVVADWGAHLVLGVSKKGEVSRIMRSEGKCVPAPEGYPDDPIELCPKGEMKTSPTPIAVVKGPDGAYYVGETEGTPPNLNGTGTVWRITGSGEPEVFATGFNAIADLAFDRGGDLLVLETRSDWSSRPSASHLIRLSKGGKRTVLLAKGLGRSTGLVLSRDGRYAYISDAGYSPMRANVKGKVLRYRL